MIQIATATMEDLAYVASWISPVDRMELAVTRDPDDYLKLAKDAFQSKVCKVALTAFGLPIFAFGAYPVSKSEARVWGFKTRNGVCAIKEVTRYLRSDMIPKLRDIGIVRASCHVHKDNRGSQRWLAHLGFEPKATDGELGTPLILYQRDEPREHCLQKQA